jgi:hypothetical protein
MVWGDSYAMHIVPGLIASDSTMELVQATESVCGPFLGVAPITTQTQSLTRLWAEGCKKFNDSVLAYLTMQTSVEVVVMSSPFNQFVNGDEYDLLIDDARIPASVSTATYYMQRTIQTLRHIGKRVVIIAPPPIADFNIGNCAERVALRKPIFGSLRGCVIDRKAYLRKRHNVLEFLREVQAAADVSVIRFDDLLCVGDACSSTVHGIPIYRDEGHFTYAGAEYVGRQMSLADSVWRLAR